MPLNFVGQMKVHHALEINFTLQTPQAFHQFSQWHEKNHPLGKKVGHFGLGKW